MLRAGDFLKMFCEEGEEPQGQFSGSLLDFESRSWYILTMGRNLGWLQNEGEEIETRIFWKANGAM